MVVNRIFESYIFTHIPKCGGTSIRNYVSENAIASGIPESAIYIPGVGKLNHDKNIPQLSKEEIGQFRNKKTKILADHSYFNVHLRHKLNLPKPFYFTFLREPLARFISHYNFFYFKNGFDKLKGISINEISLEKLDSLLNDDLCNIMTRYIANIKKEEMPMSDKVLLQAIYNLEHHFACFGYLERLKDSLQILEHSSPKWIEFSKPLLVKNKNNQNTKSLYPDKQRVELIKSKNSFDFILYKFAVDLFDLRFNHYLKKTI